MVFEHEGEHGSRWATIESVAAKMGCAAQTLQRWVAQSERDAGKRAGLSTSERERVKELEREVRELKRANEILRTASPYFAQAELRHRRPPSSCGKRPWCPRLTRVTPYAGMLRNGARHGPERWPGMLRNQWPAWSGIRRS